MTELASFGLTNNRYLDAATFETLANVTNSFSVSANGLSFEISFPVLTSAGNLSFANASFAAPQLTEVPGTLSINTAVYLDPFVLGSLERIGQDFEVANCESLTTLSMRALTTVGGGLRFDNNTQLASISLPNLESIGGSLQLQGDIESLELSSLSQVRGGATIEITSNNDTICNDFATAQERNVIQGRLNCTTGGQSSNDSSSTGTDSGSNSGSDSIGIPNTSSLSGGAIAGIVIGAIAGVAIIAFLIWYFRFRRRKQPKTISKDTLLPTDPELPRGGHHEKSELAATPNQVSELDGDGEHKVPHDRAKELSADTSQVGTMSDGSPTVIAGDSDLGSPNSRVTGPAELEDHTRHELKGSDVAELRSDRTL